MALLSRNVLFPALAVSVLAIGGAAYAWQATHYRNIPGPITGSYAAGIKGSFTFVPVSLTQGIASAPNGGACIIFRAEDLGYSKMAKIKCHSDDQCSVKGESEYGYCEPTKKHCWARPNPDTAKGSDDALCRRGNKLPSPVPISKPIEISVTPAAISTPTWKISPHAKARVLTCLNGIPGGGCGGAPGAAKPRKEWGTPKQL
jgi:hypothetical protein